MFQTAVLPTRHHSRSTKTIPQTKIGRKALVISVFIFFSAILSSKSSAFSIIESRTDRARWRPFCSSSGAARKISLGLQQEAEAELSSSSAEPSVQPLLDSILTTANRDLSEAQRIFHGRGGCYPGAEHLTLDWFPPVWVLTSFQELDPSELQLVGDTLKKQWPSMLVEGDKSNKLQNNEQLFDSSELIWVYQCRCQNNVTTTLMSGSLPEPHIVKENGCQYLVQLGPKDSSGGRNMGLFLDMRNGRQWIQENAKNKKVLNMFAYTCAFSVAAMKGGAKEVVNIDMAKGALKLGQRNHELNGFETGARFLGHNIFKSFGKLKKLGPYDIVVADPPSYQKGSFVAKKDYAKLIRRIPDLLAANYDGSTSSSYALLCLNAPELDTDFLKEQVAEVAPDLSFVEQLDNPLTFPSIDPERALKVLVYELKPKQ